MRIICDFDGTVAQNDVGNLLFTTFADSRCHDIVRHWKAGRINSRECLIQECAIARASEIELERFALSQDLDPHFKAFVAYCESRGIEVEIASDGLDFYIDRIVRKYDLENRVSVLSNRLVFTGSDTFRPEFPYFDEGCGRCGNCKGYHVRRARASHEIVVYVGDGLSDRCGAREADVVFAKNGRDLQEFCRREDILFIAYDDFADVRERVATLDGQPGTKP